MIRKLYGLLPPSVGGVVDYHFRRGHIARINPPFNGQQHRQAMFREIVTALPASAIIETGTFRASTTEFMHRHAGVPLWTVEASPRYFAFASRRLRSLSAVHTMLSDSRTFLRRLANDPAVPKEGVFFYLDAHWKQDLPLRDEVDIIARHWRRIAIMVDDFEVPGDAGYTFDDYGPGMRLDLNYFGPLERWGLHAFFPSVGSQQETGKRRGSVVLADDEARESLGRLGSLRPWTSSALT